MDSKKMPALGAVSGNIDRPVENFLSIAFPKQERNFFPWKGKSRMIRRDEMHHISARLPCPMDEGRVAMSLNHLSIDFKIALKRLQ
jgi:hypothetical protein